MTGTILVTGATGHIGSRLVPALLSADPSLSIRAATPDRPQLQEGVTWTPADFVDPSLDYDALTGDIDEVWHFGAATRWDAPDMHQINADATGRLIDAAARNGATRFIFAGTLLAYGYRRRRDVADGRCLEAPPWFPKRDKFARYGLSKFCAERAIERAERGALQTIVLRFGNVSSRARSEASVASYTAVQRRLWASRIWHVMEAEAVCARLAQLRSSTAWPASGAVAYYNFVADSSDCRIGDVVGTAPTSKHLRQPILAGVAMLDELRSWQRNGPHPGRHGLGHIVARNDRLRALDLEPELLRPDLEARGR